MNPRDVFVRSFTELCEKSNELSGMFESKCLGAAAHEFKMFLPAFASKLFNMFAKNRCSDIKSLQHSVQKRKKSDAQKDAGRKIRKLQSSA